MLRHSVSYYSKENLMTYTQKADRHNSLHRLKRWPIRILKERELRLTKICCMNPTSNLRKNGYNHSFLLPAIDKVILRITAMGALC